MDLPKKNIYAPVVEHVNIAPMVKKLTFLAPEMAKIALPGQFVHVKVSSGSQPLLRRPISISSVDLQKGTLTLIYRIIGEGTAKLAEYEPNDLLDCMGPLGRGFDLECDKPLIVGGGMGIAPLIFLVQRLCPQNVDVIIGGRTRDDMFWVDLLNSYCRNIHITTDDGSMGKRGLSVDLLPQLLANNKYDRIYACGPRPMMESTAKLAKENNIACQVSLEEYMACGVGACLSCTCQTKDGRRKKVCTDGPVFWSEEVV